MPPAVKLPTALITRSLRRLCLLMVMGLLVIAVCGCAQIRWYPDYPQGEKVARSTNRPMLLYFWDWLGRDRARTELGVFPKAPVIAAMGHTVNVRLEVGWFRDLAHQYDIRQTPTFILTDPNGVELARLAGVPTPESFVAWLDEGVRKYRAAPRAATSQPAGSRAEVPAATQPAE